jgi:hypothetical protein
MIPEPSMAIHDPGLARTLESRVTGKGSEEAPQDLSKRQVEVPDVQVNSDTRISHTIDQESIDAVEYGQVAAQVRQDDRLAPEASTEDVTISEREEDNNLSADASARLTEVRSETTLRDLDHLKSRLKAWPADKAFMIVRRDRWTTIGRVQALLEVLKQERDMNYKDDAQAADCDLLLTALNRLEADTKGPDGRRMWQYQSEGEVQDLRRQLISLLQDEELIARDG